mgnify:CR=1 FL=1
MKMKNELWVEKYRPTTLSGIVGQSNFVHDAEHWVLKKNMPNVILYGLAGTGKTAASISLVNDILGEDKEGNFFEINASDDRKLETVRTKIKDIATTKRLGEAPFKIILLDEMDGMTKDAQNALKRVMERYSDNCRFIITCNDRTKIIYPLQSRCANYYFTTLSNEDIEDFSIIRKNIGDIENYNFNEIFNKYNVKNRILLVLLNQDNLLKVFSKLNLENNEMNINKNFNNVSMENLDQISNAILDLKNDYENKWKSLNEINTSIILPIRLSVDSNNFLLSNNLKNYLNEVDLISNYKIENFNSKQIIYKIIFNSTPDKFLKIMKNAKFQIDTSKDVWKLQ